MSYKGAYPSLPGLCRGTKFDQTYTWNDHPDPESGFYSFNGYTDTSLFYVPANESWKLELHSDPSVFALLRTDMYPFGTNAWTVFKDECGTKEGVLLNFNACTEDEFNCAEGTCVNMTARHDLTYICIVR